jgi:hypothetical protein
MEMGGLIGKSFWLFVYSSVLLWGRSLASFIPNAYVYSLLVMTDFALFYLLFDVSNWSLFSFYSVRYKWGDGRIN